jgi:hypothetical protein
MDDALIAFLAKETAEEHAPIDEEETEPCEVPAAPVDDLDPEIPF